MKFDKAPSDYASSLRHEIGRRIRNRRRKRIDGFGHDFAADVRERLRHVKIETIFDVGAHIGMTAIEFSDQFPTAELRAFEPHPGNFARMKGNLVGKPDIRLHQVGMGAEPGSLPFHFDPAHPSMARVASHGEEVTGTVQIDTLDRFCATNGIERIDLLKIDVEGHELPVLKGASGLLKSGAISIIRMESAIDPDTRYHVQLFDLCEVLHPYRYRIFGFYDQNEFPPEPHLAKLRRFDVAFISPLIALRP